MIGKWNRESCGYSGLFILKRSYSFTAIQTNLGSWLFMRQVSRHFDFMLISIQYTSNKIVYPLSWILSYTHSHNQFISQVPNRNRQNIYIYIESFWISVWIVIRLKRFRLILNSILKCNENKNLCHLFQLKNDNEKSLPTFFSWIQTIVFSKQIEGTLLNFSFNWIVLFQFQLCI